MKQLSSVGWRQDNVYVFYIWNVFVKLPCEQAAPSLALRPALTYLEGWRSTTLGRSEQKLPLHFSPKIPRGRLQDQQQRNTGLKQGPGGGGQLADTG